VSDLRDDTHMTYADRATDGSHPGEVATGGAPAPDSVAPTRSIDIAPAPLAARTRTRTTPLGRQFECRLARWSSWIRVDF
jgi:hypothetical protein